MHRRAQLWQSLTVILILVLVGCTSKAPATDTAGQATESGTLTVVDALGRTVSWDSLPERIVIAGKSNFFINNAVYLFPEAQERVVALTSAKQTTAPFLALLDPGYEEKVIFTPESTAEELATAQPDVVLLKRFMRETVGDGLEMLGIPVVYLDLETPEQYKRDLATLGTVFGAPDRAAAVWDFYETRITHIEDTLTDLDEADRSSVLVVQYNTKGAETALEVPPASWIQTDMVKTAGGDAVWLSGTQGNGWTIVSLEQIAAWNPDTIIVISYFDPVDDVVERLTADANWQGLAAVRNNQVYGFPADYYSWDQPDTRWILGLTWLAGKLHPDRFENLAMGEEIVAFYSELYNLDTGTVNSEVLPLLQGDVSP